MGHKTKPDEKSYVWSLGQLLYRVFCRKTEPLDIVKSLTEAEDNYSSVYESYVQVDKAVPFSYFHMETHTPLTKFFSETLRADPEVRCTLKEACNLFRKIPMQSLSFEHFAVLDEEAGSDSDNQP